MGVASVIITIEALCTVNDPLLGSHSSCCGIN